MKKLLQDFISLNIALLILILIVRLFELFYISPVFNLPPDTYKYEIYGLFYDLLFLLKITSILLIPYALLYLAKPAVARWFFTIAGTSIVLVSVALSFYFGTAKIPLGADLFGYSFSEISSTSMSSGTINLLSLFIFILFTALSLWIFFRLRMPAINTFVVYTGSLLLLFILVFGTYGKAHMKNEFDSFTASNKTGFLVESVLNKYKGSGSDEMLVTGSAGDLKTGYDFAYTDKAYPFLHKNNTPDLLGSYFNKTKEPPTFVFIVVESLGRAYSGNSAYLGSFTPFLDSLSQHGLYWESMLSTSGRTFSVLPSLLGSLPFGEKGFCEMGKDMPASQSLISLLKPYHYNSAFYYGGDAAFDNMSLYLKTQQIDKILDKTGFGPADEKLPSNANGFSWGYGDKAIFNRYLSDVNTRPAGPRVDVILTISMHDPFLIKDQDVYNSKFDKRQASLNLSADKKDYNKLYKAQLATVLYFDDALRGLIREYSKRKDFANTIFIITGDHRMPEIPIATQLDRFHVPLLIWSPMIRKPQVIKSVSTHFDLLPSLLAFLQNNYQMHFPANVAWVGHGLDMQASFRNIHTYPLMRNKNELMDFISGEYFLSGSDLYKVYPSLDIEPLADAGKLNLLKNQFSLFRKMNTEVSTTKHLLPDSLLKIK